MTIITRFLPIVTLIFACVNPIFASEINTASVRQRVNQELTDVKVRNEQKANAEYGALRTLASNVGIDVNSVSNREIRELFDVFPPVLQQMIFDFIGEKYYLFKRLQNYWQAGQAANANYYPISIKCDGSVLTISTDRNECMKFNLNSTSLFNLLFNTPKVLIAPFDHHMVKISSDKSFKMVMRKNDTDDRLGGERIDLFLDSTKLLKAVVTKTPSSYRESQRSYLSRLNNKYTLALLVAVLAVVYYKYF